MRFGPSLFLSARRATLKVFLQRSSLHELYIFQRRLGVFFSSSSCTRAALFLAQQLYAQQARVSVSLVQQQYNSSHAASFSRRSQPYSWHRSTSLANNLRLCSNLPLCRNLLVVVQRPVLVLVCFDYQPNKISQTTVSRVASKTCSFWCFGLLSSGDVLLSWAVVHVSTNFRAGTATYLYTRQNHNTANTPLPEQSMAHLELLPDKCIHSIPVSHYSPHHLTTPYMVAVGGDSCCVLRVFE